MRKLFVLPLWASLGLVAYACDDGTTPSAAHDGGSAEAAPTGTTPPLTDGGPPTDSSTPAVDAGPQAGPVTALVINDVGAPAANQDVYFTEPGGTLVKVTTGVDGKATHTMFPGGSLLASYVASNGTTYWTTVLGVAPGDIVRVNPTSSLAAGTGGTITGTLANAPTVDAGAVSYGFNPPCGGVGVTPGDGGSFPYDYSYTVSPWCVDATGSIGLLAIALDSTTNQVLAYAPKIVAFPDGGSPVANIAAGDWLPATSRAMAFSGALDPAYTYMNTSIETPRGGASYLQASYAGSLLPGAPVPYTVAPAAFAPNVQATTSLNGNYYNPDAGITITESLSVTHYQRIPSTTPLTENVGAFLPRIYALSSTVAPTTATPVTVSWKCDSALPADGFGIIPAINGSLQVDGGQLTQLQWQIVFPVHANTTSVSVPPLPPALASQANLGGAYSIYHVTIGASAQAPYALARQYPSVIGTPKAFSPLVPAAVSFDVKTTELDLAL